MVGYRDNMFFIPSGTHEIECKSDDMPGFSTAQLQPQILTFTGNVSEIKYGMRKIYFTYESTEKSLISLNSKPTEIKVDDKIIPFEVLKGNDCFSVFLPVGKHSVAIETGDKFSYGLSITSLWSISAIAIYGIIAVIALIIMFVALKIVRRRLEK